MNSNDLRKLTVNELKSQLKLMIMSFMSMSVEDIKQFHQLNTDLIKNKTNLQDEDGEYRISYSKLLTTRYAQFDVCLETKDVEYNCNLQEKEKVNCRRSFHMLISTCRNRRRLMIYFNSYVKRKNKVMCSKRFSLDLYSKHEVNRVDHMTRYELERSLIMLTRLNQIKGDK